MVFQDKTGFSLHPRLGFGWATLGQRLRVPTTSHHRERLHVSGWVAPLLGRVGVIRTPRGDREGFLKILRHLSTRLQGSTIWLYVDGARWHKGDTVREFLQRHPRLHVDYLPPYQPALNMQERVWRRVRSERTTNHWFGTTEEIWRAVTKTTRSWTADKIRKLCNII